MPKIPVVEAPATSEPTIPAGAKPSIDRLQSSMIGAHEAASRAAESFKSLGKMLEQPFLEYQERFERNTANDAFLTTMKEYDQRQVELDQEYTPDKDPTGYLVRTSTEFSNIAAKHSKDLSAGAQDLFNQYIRSQVVYQSGQAAHKEAFLHDVHTKWQIGEMTSVTVKSLLDLGTDVDAGAEMLNALKEQILTTTKGDQHMADLGTQQATQTWLKTIFADKTKADQVDVVTKQLYEKGFIKKEDYPPLLAAAKERASQVKVENIVDAVTSQPYVRMDGSIDLKDSLAAAFRMQNEMGLDEAERKKVGDALQQAYAYRHLQRQVMNDDALQGLYQKYPQLAEAGKTFSTADLNRMFADFPDLNAKDKEHIERVNMWRINEQRGLAERPQPGQLKRFMDTVDAKVMNGEHVPLSLAREMLSEHHYLTGMNYIKYANSGELSLLKTAKQWAAGYSAMYLPDEKEIIAGRVLKDLITLREQELANRSKAGNTSTTLSAKDLATMKETLDKKYKLMPGEKESQLLKRITAESPSNTLGVQGSPYPQKSQPNSFTNTKTGEKMMYNPNKQRYETPDGKEYILQQGKPVRVK